MSDQRSSPDPGALPSPGRRWPIRDGTESAARPLEPGQELTIVNESGSAVFVRAAIVRVARDDAGRGPFDPARDYLAATGPGGAGPDMPRATTAEEDAGGLTS